MQAAAAARRNRHDHQLPARFGLLALVHIACRLADCIGFSALRPTQPPKFRHVLRDLPLPARSNFGVIGLDPEGRHED